MSHYYPSSKSKNNTRKRYFDYFIADYFPTLNKKDPVPNLGPNFDVIKVLQKGGPVLVCHGKDGAGMVVIKRWDKWGLKHPQTHITEIARVQMGWMVGISHKLSKYKRQHKHHRPYRQEILYKFYVPSWMTLWKLCTFNYLSIWTIFSCPFSDFLLYYPIILLLYSWKQ